MAKKPTDGARVVSRDHALQIVQKQYGDSAFAEYSIGLTGKTATCVVGAELPLGTPHILGTGKTWTDAIRKAGLPFR